MTDYPCPSCGSHDPLFVNDRSPSDAAYAENHPALTVSYACMACLSAAKLVPGMPFVAPTIDLTSANHR